MRFRPQSRYRNTAGLLSDNSGMCGVDCGPTKPDAALFILVKCHQTTPDRCQSWYAFRVRRERSLTASKIGGFVDESVYVPTEGFVTEK